MNYSDVLFVPLGRRIGDFWVTSPTTGFVVDDGNRDIVDALDSPCLGSQIERLLDIAIDTAFVRNFATCGYAYPVVAFDDAVGLDRLVPFATEPNLDSARVEASDDTRYVNVVHARSRARIHRLAWEAFTLAHGHPEGFGHARRVLRDAGGDAWTEHRFTALTWGAVLATSSVGMFAYHRLPVTPSQDRV